MRKQPESHPNDVLRKLYFYSDYRSFLQDYFQEQKRLKEHFSHRFFARKAGLSSPSMILDVLKGRYNLTIRTLPRIVAGLGLKGKNARFFENLVWFNQSKDAVRKEHYYRQMVQLRVSAKFYRLHKDQYAYFEHFSYAVIRELAVYSNWAGDFRKLGAMVEPPVNAATAEKALDVLVKCGLLARKPDGSFEQSDPALTFEDVPSAVKKPYRRMFLQLGMDAAERLGPDKRYCAHTLLSMSRESYQEAVSILDEAREKIMALALNDGKVEQVYELILQHYPLSKVIGEGTL